MATYLPIHIFIICCFLYGANSIRQAGVAWRDLHQRAASLFKVHQCARKAAFLANLVDAAEVLATEDSDHWQTVEDWRHRLGPVDCREALLYRQRGARLPTPWPNWHYRLLRSAEAS